MTHMKILPSLLAALLCSTLLGGCGASGPLNATTPAAAAAGSVQVWLTTGDQRKLLAAEPALPTGAAAEALEIEVDAAQRFQTMTGFGAAITDASAWLIQQRMNPAQREALLEELFSRKNGGLGFDLTRLTIGASDFSRSHYSFADLPPGQTDMALASFSIAPNRAEVLPALKAALAVNPRLQVMASPWSAPGWMKSSDSLIKGALKPEMYGVFSDYLIRYLQAYAAEGVNIFALTLQNEPHFEPADYPGMRLDPAARAAVIGQHLGPKLKQLGLKTQILDWDHNWDEPQSPLAVLADDRARPYVSGVAWHCYAGDVKAQSQVREAYPDKEVWFTECSGGEWDKQFDTRLSWLMQNLIIGSTRHWARGVLMWNLALDRSYGPHLGGCKDCHGIVTIDAQTGAVVGRSVEYYAFGHASRFVRPGAQRIASGSAGSNSDGGGLLSVAFRNADDGSIALLVHNSAAQARRFSVRQGSQRFAYELPARSVATFTWQP